VGGVARLAPKLDRQTGTLVINGFWLEAEASADDSALAEALGQGLARFASFVGARQIDLTAIQPQRLQTQLHRILSNNRP